MKLRIHALVSGMVQGVFFRSETRRIATDLGIKGWVRNLPDGKVEVVAEGEEDNIYKLIEFLKQGPVAARVNKVDIKTENFKNEFKDFEIKY
jgi:acylphosphatase